MQLTSPEYFILLALVFFAYWFARRTGKLAVALILCANYFFYAKWHPIYLGIIPLAATCDFFIGRALGARKSRFLVTLSIVLNCGLILTSHYVPFLLDPFGISQWEWLLPLSLSFYAFQAMTYTIDIYRGDATPTPSLLSYLASVSFFPTIVAGPITRVARLLPQIENTGLSLSAEDGGRALFLIGLGLMKKLLIADYLGENLVNRVFDLPKLYSGMETLLGAYGYAFQLYYDFSGYTDIALGSALLLGITLPANFNRPYAAINIADFWRRWHISLSNWLRDYLFFSLPGQRSRWRPYLNLFITFTLGGLWHGANWTFVIWGALHGTGLAVVRGLQAMRGKRKPQPGVVLRVVSTVVTFHFVVLTWVFFRSANVSTALDVLRQIDSGTVSFANVTPGFWMVLAIAVAAHYVPHSWYTASLNAFTRMPAPVQATALAALIIGIRYVAATGSAPFIYSRF
jgi:D-alanyl-lipoteichoic acid acyltransferase DltB (MBOAT superfamily)